MRAITAARAAAAVLVAWTASAIAPPSARAADAQVEVRDNSFSPRELSVSSGDTVTWTVTDSGHTIRSDAKNADGTPLFEFPQGAGTLMAGTSHTHAFETAGAFSYHCEVHPGSMTGTVFVDVSPPGPTVRAVPSDRFPDIATALAGAPPGSTIELAPGTYREAVTIDVEGITLRGAAGENTAVVLDGQGTRPVGIAVFAPGVTVENLSVVGHTQRGLLLRGADRFRLDRVRAENNGAYGVRVIGSRGGGVTRSQVTGGTVAGLSIADCDACGTLVQGVTAAGNSVGILVEDAGHVVIAGSVASGNRVGIRFATRVPDRIDTGPRHAPARGATIVENDVSRSATGIAITGGWHVAVRDNIVGGVDGPGIKWDLAGLDVCFSGNRDPQRPDADPRTDPPELQRLFPCPGPLGAR